MSTPDENGAVAMANDHAALVRRFYEEVWQRGNLDVAHDVFVDDYVRHDPRATPAAPGPEGQKRIAADFRAAFPDLRFHVDLVIADGDLVAARTGAWGNQPPTGRTARFSGVNIFRFQGRHVVEIWNHRDDLGLMQQLDAPIFAGAQQRDP